MKTIREMLDQPQSKKSRDLVVNSVLNNPEKIDDLFAYFFDSDSRLCQKASWSLTVIGDRNPGLILPFLESMITVLDKPVHNAVKRNIVRLLQNADVPEDLEGMVYEKCYNYLNDSREKAALRVFSLTVLTNIALRHVELKDELEHCIRMHYANGSAGFKSRAAKELARLKK